MMVVRGKEKRGLALRKTRINGLKKKKKRKTKKTAQMVGISCEEEAGNREVVRFY